MSIFLIIISIVVLTPVAFVSIDVIRRSRFKMFLNRLKFRNLISHLKLIQLNDRINFTDLKSRLKSTILRKKGLVQEATLDEEPDLEVLNCRVKLGEQKKGTSIVDAFTLAICGSIRVTENTNSTSLRVSVLDVTDGACEGEPVQAQAKQWRMQDSSVFCYNTDLGKLPQQDMILPDWTSVARLHLDWLMFPRKGKRNLQFDVSIHSGSGGEKLASAKCNYIYDNPVFGYIDVQENVQRTQTLAVALAFAVSAADNKLYDCEVELIKDWARGNIDLSGTSFPSKIANRKTSQPSEKARRKLDRALDKTVAFFRHGNQLDTYKICREAVEISPLAGRYDVLNLCLYVAQANGSVAPEELALLKNLADWLEVDMDRFREMTERILPVCMHDVTNAEEILWLTSDMNKEKTRQHLNREYSKWNSRVTSSNPEIQKQADQMLKLIAEARNEYIG